MNAAKIGTTLTVSLLLAATCPAQAQAAPGDETGSASAASAVAQSTQSAQTAITPRTYAPDPQAFAAAAATSSRPIRISIPGSSTQVIGPGATAAARTTTIVVPDNAQAGTPFAAAEDEFYEPGLPAPITDPTYATYETLIRAGGPPSYSISTLHRPFPSLYSAARHHDHAAAHRYDAHNRPFSSRLRDHGSPGHDPFAGDLHRSAQLRFYEASRPRLAPGHSRRDDRPAVRDRSTRDVRPFRGADRERSDRSGGDDSRSGNSPRYRRTPK